MCGRSRSIISQSLRHHGVDAVAGAQDVVVLTSWECGACGRSWSESSEDGAWASKCPRCGADSPTLVHIAALEEYVRVSWCGGPPSPRGAPVMPDERMRSS